MTIRPSDSVSQASYYHSKQSTPGTLIPYDHSWSLASQNTYESRPTTTITRTSSTRGDSSARTHEVSRASSTRGGSSSRRSSSTRERELERKIERLEADKAKALEQKVKDLERKLENMHVDNVIERKAMRNAYYQQESRRINDYALSFDGEAYYVQLLNRVNPSRYVYL